MEFKTLKNKIEVTNKSSEGTVNKAPKIVMNNCDPEKLRSGIYRNGK